MAKASGNDRKTVIFSLLCQTYWVSCERWLRNPLCEKCTCWLWF